MIWSAFIYGLQTKRSRTSTTRAAATTTQRATNAQSVGFLYFSISNMVVPLMGLAPRG